MKAVGDRKQKIGRIQTRLAAAFPIVLTALCTGLVAHVLGQALERYSLQAIWQSLQQIPTSSIAIALVLTGLNYFVLTGYDTLGMRYALGSRHGTLRYRQMALVAMVSTAISNTIGLTVLTGGAIRYRFYLRWGATLGAIAQNILFCNLSFWVGFLIVGGFWFSFDPQNVAALLHLQEAWMQPLGALCLGVMLGYLGWSLAGQRSLSLKLLGFELYLPHLRFSIVLGQLAVTVADWLTVSLLLYTLLPAPLLPSFGSFLGLYLLAKAASLISNVPGGLGVFETILLLGLAPPEAAVPKVLGVFLAYRGIYYWLPFAIAVLTWCTYELQHWSGNPFRRK